MGRNWWIGNRPTDVLGADLEVDLERLKTSLAEAANSYSYHPTGKGFNLREMNNHLSFEDNATDAELFITPPANWSDNQYHMLGIFAKAYLTPGMAWFRSSVPNSDKVRVITQFIDSLDLLTPALAKQPNRVQEISRKLAHASGASIAGEIPDESLQQLRLYDSRVIAQATVGQSVGLTSEEQAVIAGVGKLLKEASEAAATAAP